MVDLVPKLTKGRLVSSGKTTSCAALRGREWISSVLREWLPIKFSGTFCREDRRWTLFEQLNIPISKIPKKIPAFSRDKWASCSARFFMPGRIATLLEKSGPPYPLWSFILPISVSVPAPGLAAPTPIGLCLPPPVTDPLLSAQYPVKNENNRSIWKKTAAQPALKPRDLAQRSNDLDRGNCHLPVFTGWTHLYFFTTTLASPGHTSGRPVPDYLDPYHLYSLRLLGIGYPTIAGLIAVYLYWFCNRQVVVLVALVIALSPVLAFAANQ